MGCVGLALDGDIVHRRFVDGVFTEVDAIDVVSQVLGDDVLLAHRLDRSVDEARSDRTRPAAGSDSDHVDLRAGAGHLAVVEEDVPRQLGCVPVERHRTVAELGWDGSQVVGHELGVHDQTQAVGAIGRHAGDEGVAPVGCDEQSVDLGVEVVVRHPLTDGVKTTFLVGHRNPSLLYVRVRWLYFSPTEME